MSTPSFKPAAFGAVKYDPAHLADLLKPRDGDRPFDPLSCDSTESFALLMVNPRKEAFSSSVLRVLWILYHDLRALGLSAESAFRHPAVKRALWQGAVFCKPGSEMATHLAFAAKGNPSNGFYPFFEALVSAFITFTTPSDFAEALAATLAYIQLCALATRDPEGVMREFTEHAIRVMEAREEGPRRDHFLEVLKAGCPYPYSECPRGEDDGVERERVLAAVARTRAAYIERMAEKQKAAFARELADKAKAEAAAKAVQRGTSVPVPSDQLKRKTREAPQAPQEA